MDIREAVRGCLKDKGILGRPQTWEAGEAVDLARRFHPSEAKVISVFQGNRPVNRSVGLSSWKPTPEELLGEWELISFDDLRGEISGG